MQRDTMRPENGTKDIIRELNTVFSKAAIDCVRAIFSKECKLHTPFQVVERLQGSFDFILSMSSISNVYNALVCIGVQNDSMQTFLDRTDIDLNESGDILGEFANSYLGLLQDSPDFHSNFGNMAQGLPTFFKGGQVFLPFIWGIQGYLFLGTHWIYLGYTIRSNLS